MFYLIDFRSRDLNIVVFRLIIGVLNIVIQSYFMILPHQ